MTKRDGGIVYEKLVWDDEEPFDTQTNQPTDDLREIFKAIFGERDVWEVIDRQGNKQSNRLTPTQKKMFLKLVCDGKYTESDLIFIRAVEDFSSGFAFTRDAFCYGGDFRKHVTKPLEEFFDKLKRLSTEYWNSIPRLERGFVKYHDITGVEFAGWDSSLLERKEADDLTINFALHAPELKLLSFEDEHGVPLRAATSEWMLIGQMEQTSLWREIDDMPHCLKIERGKLRSFLIDRKTLWQVGKFLEFVKA
ncbi:MAG: hypothetical protein IKI76_00445 [Selenomonadaceae bacterium]|nr:hypothetical protein [Selenomonadaceae bacterium]